MKLSKQLAEHVLEAHPNQASTVLERLERSELVRLLDSTSLKNSAAVVERLSPQATTAVIGGVSLKRAAGILDALQVDSAARATRRLTPERQELVLKEVSPKRAKSIQSVLQFPLGSAGSIMDPDVLALPEDLAVRDALQRVRESMEFSRYNLYIVDQSQRLVGVVNLRELLLASDRDPLGELMTPDPHRIVATADKASVIAHPGWKQVHALPVVDHADAFLGAIRYRVLRQLEEDFLTTGSEDMDTGTALGEIVSAGVRGLLDAVTRTADLGLERNRDRAN